MHKPSRPGNITVIWSYGCEIYWIWLEVGCKKCLTKQKLRAKGWRTRCSEKSSIAGDIFSYPGPSTIPVQPGQWGFSSETRELDLKMEWFKNYVYTRYWGRKARRAQQEEPKWKVIRRVGDQLALPTWSISYWAWYFWWHDSLVISRRDPQTFALRDWLRDGTFYIENGQIKFPVKTSDSQRKPVILQNNI